MGRLEKPIIVRLSCELSSWLDEKVRSGYTKAGLVRHILDEYRRAETERKV